ncbi:zinc finger protein 888-like [Anopheles bellator]|uniref:zinc finger protein 888-like n=1 Tax=Anopheles bellator TaxID=139047 RepID=UPI002649181E|nr:zinc finger protein 888-like [Anopheles bellator]
MASRQSSGVVCRICSANTSLTRAIYIFSISGEQLEDGSKTIADNIAEFADVTINNDDEHSPYLCPVCFKAFNNAAQLRQQIRDAESAVLSVLQSIEMQGSVVEYELEYLDEFRDQISGTVVPKESIPPVLTDVRSDVEALSEGEDDLLAKQMTLQLSEEEMDTLEGDPLEQGRFVFEMPRDELIARRIVFPEFEYLEIHGERCCGCPHIAATHDELVEHAGEKHSHNYYADSSYTCPTCYTKFPTEEALSKHIHYYSYNDVFLCIVCQKAFNFHSHLMLHRAKHHEEAEMVMEHDQEGADKNSAAKRCRKTERAELTVLPDARFIKEIHERPGYKEYQLNGERCCSCGVLQDSMEAHVTEMHLQPGNTRALKGALPYCAICRRRFSSEREKLLHEEQRRTVNQIYECRTCGKIFRRRLMLMRHLVKHAKEVKVEVTSAAENATVSEAAPSEASTKAVTLATATKQLACYCCCFTRCQQEYNTENELLSHALEAHSGRRNENEIMSKKQHPDLYSGSLYCPICLRVFESARKLAQHRLYKARAEKNRCHHCGRCFIKPHALREHQEREHLDLPPQHECEICGKHFQNRTTLLHHQSVHGPFKKIPCAAENCDIVFRDERLMRRHFRNVHAEHTPYECPHCQKKYRAKEALDIHVRCHTGDRPFPCRYDGCQRRFSHGTDRLRHERAAHTGERPHKCPSCGATFIRRRELRIHFNRQHKEA